MTSPGSCLMNARQYLTAVKVFEILQDYTNAIEISLWTLENTNESSIYPLIIDTLHRHSSIWKLANMSSRIASVTWAKHLLLSSRGISERSIMIFMAQLIQTGVFISEDDKKKLQNDMQVKASFNGNRLLNGCIKFVADIRPPFLDYVSRNVLATTRN
jgi:hypothetical protein